MAITIEDIADKLGISHSTVSDVLNDKWQERGVSEETKGRILVAAKRLNYRSNIIARSLVTRQTKVLGLITQCVTYSFFPEIARGIEDTAREYGYKVLLCHSDDSVDREAEEIELLREHRVAGLIITPAHDRDNIDIFLGLQKDRIPFVLVDKYLEGLECNFVGTDDRQGAYEAVTHLIKLGHKRIAYIMGEKNASSTRDRLKGYQDALIENNIICDPELIVGGDGFIEEYGYKAAKELLTLNRKPTAIFAITDMAAVGALQAITESGLRVPEDIALIGFCDNKGAATLSVPLTTVRQPAREIGRQAARILLDEIENGIDEPKRIALKTELIIRKSCGAYLGRRQNVLDCHCEKRNDEVI